MTPENKVEKMPFTITIDPTIMADYQNMIEEHKEECNDGCGMDTVDLLIEDQMISCIRNYRVHKVSQYGRNR